VGDVLPIDQHSSGVGWNQSHDNVKAGGFPGAVWAQQANNFALFYMEIDIADDPTTAVTFADLLSR
jgi:hypothetical protein